MPNFYIISEKETPIDGKVSESEKFSVFYHDIFDYPLTLSDLVKWTPAKPLAQMENFSVIKKDGYFFIKGHTGLIYKRILRKRISSKKTEIAQKMSNYLSLIPSVKMVALTGSLAMENSTDESDIDLFVVTSSNLLWTTRLLSYSLLKILGIDVRKPGTKRQKDKLCLNMWMDESNLIWRHPRNIYTSHEVAQVVPLVNRDKTYEQFIWKNKWIINFWPNAVKIERQKKRNTAKNTSFFQKLIEKIAYQVQYKHMREKITREIVSPGRAIFHPEDWGEIVLRRFS